MQVPAAIQQRVTDKLVEVIAICEKQFNRKFTMPTVAYDIVGTTAGYANYGMHRIRLHPILLMENLEQMINETVPHEMAHLITGLVYPHIKERTFAYSGFGVKATKCAHHGPEWQGVMRLMGLNPARCHSMDTSSFVVKHAYVCSTCNREYKLTQRRHNKFQKNTAAYRCHCKGKLFPQVVAATKEIKVSEIIGKLAAPETFTERFGVNSAATATTGFGPSSGTKLYACYGLFKTMKMVLSRTEMINLFVQRANCTAAGAGTYYSTCKKNFDDGTWN